MGRQNGKALKDAPEEMKGDRELCTAAVAQDGEALQYCSRELQKDRKISTIAAVRRNGQALKDVPEEMKGDRDVCKAAVALDWRAFEYVSIDDHWLDMRSNLDVILAAYENINHGQPPGGGGWDKEWCLARLFEMVPEE